jgi:hypothetical protein
MTVLETLRCPGCSTHYLLAPARVRPGLKRARCFRCSSVFTIEAEVARLLGAVNAMEPVPVIAPEPPPAAAAEPAPGFFEEPPALTLDDLQGIQDELLEPPGGTFPDIPMTFPPLAEEPDLTLAETPEGLAEEMDSFRFAEEPETSAFQFAEEPEATGFRFAEEPEPTGFRFADEPPAPLDLGAGARGDASGATAPLDLKGAGFRMPEKTRPEPEPEAAAGSHFTSARDAIEKLMGQAPPVPTTRPRLGGRGSMDMEATLDALETTLSGPAPAESPAPGAVPAPVPPAPSLAPAPPAPGTASTVKLSTEEIRAAMAAAQAAAPAEPARPEFQPRVEPPPAPAPAAQSPDLLKIQLETEVCNNLTVDQMTAWIEQGRVQEYHMVARQFSENWIEAVKVPTLRPVFDRVRKARAAVQPELPATPAPEPPAPKRGLFGGLFGRN